MAFSNVTQISGSTLTGGTWVVAGTGSLLLPGGDLAENDAAVVLSDSGSFPQVAALTNNVGSLSILGGDSLTLTSDLQNAGTLIVGPASVLSVMGSLTIPSAGSVTDQIAGAADSQRGTLDVAGTAALAGTLEVSLVNGFTPGPGQSFPFMSAAVVSSQFSSVVNVTPASPLRFVADYSVPGVVSIVNSAPIVDLNGAAAGTLFAATWSHSGAVSIADPSGATLADAGIADLTSLTVAIESPQPGDTLTADVAGTLITTEFSGGTLSLTGSDSLADYQLVLRTIKYDNIADSTAASVRTIDVMAGDGVLASAIAQTTVDLISAVNGRELFYNDSKYDHKTPGISTSDDGAIAIDKTAYLPGTGAATVASVSSFIRGINGIMVDLQGAGAHSSISLANILNDFTFKMGDSNAPDTWATAPNPISLSVRAGAGTGGSDRVELVWADNAMRETWLEVQVLANSDTGLESSDEFFYGNAPGDDFIGETTLFATSAQDDVDARAHIGTATITNLYDYNKDGFVNASDSVSARVTGALGDIDVGNPSVAPSVESNILPQVVSQTGSPQIQFVAAGAIASALADSPANTTPVILLPGMASLGNTQEAGLAPRLPSAAATELLVASAADSVFANSESLADVRQQRDAPTSRHLCDISVTG